MDQEQIDQFAETAHNLVDFVIESAIKRLEQEGKERQETLQSIRNDIAGQPPSSDRRKPINYDDYDMPNIEWLTIQEFSVEKGEEKIAKFIKTWEYGDSWLYCVDYLGKDDHEFDVRHRYRVRWSIPTRRKPIPRATASVYFTFEVSKIKPKDYPADIYYVFETNSLVHRPGESRFREKWLKDIIESKTILMEAIDF